jgi:hypothetical protein
MRTWHEFFRYQIQPEEQYVLAAPYEQALRDIVARYHVKIYLHVDGNTELWNHNARIHYDGFGPDAVQICDAPIPPNAEIALQYNQSSSYYGAYTIGCDGMCATTRKQMRWRIYNELKHMNPLFHMLEYTEKELYNEFIKHHNAQTTTALMVVWMRIYGSPFSSMPHDLFRWFVKKYLLKPMESFCYTGPRMPTHEAHLLTMARLINVMLIADGSAPLRYQH